MYGTQMSPTESQRPISITAATAAAELLRVTGPEFFGLPLGAV